MQMTRMQREMIGDDDFAVAARPWHWRQFWNYGNCPTIQNLAAEDRKFVHPKLSLFVGDSGCGKSSAARVRGMIASCKLVADTPRERWSQLPRVPCGECRGCRQVHIDEAIQRDGYFEINGSDRDATGDIDNALNKVFYPKHYGSNLLPYVLAIHEAVDLPARAFAMLKHQVEMRLNVEFILLLRKPELKQVPKPLMNRCDGVTYEFGLPSHVEACAGIERLVDQLGLTVEPGMVEHLVGRFNANPRACLAALNRTRMFWPTVELKHVNVLFPE